jgi:hypothetical protein
MPKDDIEILDDDKQDNSAEPKRKYADVFETVEELEKSYTNSQREATSMAEKVKKADEYEQTLQEFESEGLITRDETGKIQRVKKEESIDDIDNVPLTRKELREELERRESEKTQRESYMTNTKKHWDKAVEEFPEIMKDGQIDRTTALYKEADRILREELAEKLPSGKWYIPPRSQYDAFVLADRILRKKEQLSKEEEKEEIGIKKVNKFVDGGKGGKGKQKSKELSDDEYAALSPDEQEKYDRESAGL